MIYYTVYKTINTVNGKYYIGVHKTNNPNDKYLGSGIALKRAFKKYGIENFKKEILFIFDNKNDAYIKESEIVTKKFIDNENVYNAKIGGFGGWPILSKEIIIKKSQKRKGKNFLKESRIGPNNPMFGKKHNA